MTTATIETPPTPATSARMARVRSGHTTPELALRRELHRRGLRFRLAASPPLPGRPDLIFPKVKVAVFVDGCFWHACPAHFRVPRTNRAWWIAKIARNVARDQDADAALHAAGWTVVRAWEHDDPAAAAGRAEAAVRRREGTGDAGWLHAHLRDDHGIDPALIPRGLPSLRRAHAAQAPHGGRQP